MTPEQLDEARAREANRLVYGSSCFNKHDQVDLYAVEAARLAREGWEPVDPDLIEAREIVATTNCAPTMAFEVRRGDFDRDTRILAALAAIKRGRELERGQ